MINKALKHYNFNKDNDLRYEYPNGYGKHNKKVVLTVYQCEPVAEVYLSDDEFMLIDIIDLILLENNPFTEHSRNDSQHCGRANGASRKYFHRLSIQATCGLQVDHINHNPLDNRRINLRECTARQNNIAKRNSRVNGMLNTNYIGVLECETHDGNTVYRVKHPVEGYYQKAFDCDWEAAEYRDEVIADHYWGIKEGEWFTSNFINWNFEPTPHGLIYNEAQDYEGYMEHVCNESLQEGIAWLKQQDWTKPFYNAYLAKYVEEEDELYCI